MQPCPNVLIDADRLVGPPEQAAAEEGGEEKQAIVPLGFGASHVEFVEEPVHVEKRGGHFVKDEGRAVEVDKWALVVSISQGVSRTVS